MRVLQIGAGGVGAAAVSIAARRDFFDAWVVADYDLARASKAAAAGGSRFSAAQVDASSAESVRTLAVTSGATHVFNAVDPRFVVPVFEGAFEAGADYLDMAMSLSDAAKGVLLGDAQFAAAPAWEEAGRLALVGIGVEPGLSDVFARYAADELFASVDEVGVRDGSNLVVYDQAGAPAVFAPTFSIWTTLEECLNPPVVWEKGRGWYTDRAVLRAGGLRLPGRHRPGRVRQRGARGGAAHPALGAGHRAGHVQVRARRRVHRRAAHAAPTRPGVDGAGAGRRGVGRAARRGRRVPARPGDAGRPDARQDLRRHLGRGTGVDGRPREVYLYHVVDNEWSMREYGHQAVVWQTAINPVVALELLASGAWQGAGRARAGGVRPETVPRPADGVRLALGHALAFRRCHHRSSTPMRSTT